jgi:hypothetical protein
MALVQRPVWVDDAGRPSYLTAGPAPRPAYWLEWIKQPLTPGELETLRQCVVRGAPFGAAGWVKRTAERLHLQSTQSPSPVGEPWPLDPINKRACPLCAPLIASSQSRFVAL